MSLKPSSIPRPQTTPTKGTSFMTNYGYRSPKEVNTKDIAKPVSSSEELQRLKERVEDKENVLKEQMSNNLTLRTQIQKMEESYTELEERVLSLTQSLHIKMDSLHSVEEEFVVRLEELQRDLKLKKVELETGNLEALNHKEKLYQTQMTSVLQQKHREVVEEKEKLQGEVKRLQGELENNDAIVSAHIDQLKQESGAKEEELLKLMVDTKETLLKEMDELVEHKKEMELKIRALKAKIVQLEDEKNTEINNLQSLCMENSEISKEHDSLRDKLTQLQLQLSTKKDTINELKQEIQWKFDTKIQLDKELIQEEAQRRVLHNKLQELKGNIRVFCRIRPKLVAEVDEELLQIEVPDNEEVKQEVVISASKKYQFDKVFQQDSTNTEVFEEVSQLVQSALYGFNICIFAYGQTGSGKTHTMLSEDGIIPLSIKHIYESCHRQKDWNYTVSGEFLEIHNETIKDLLREDTTQKYEIKHQNKTTYITNMTRLEFSTPQEMIHTLQKALKNRSIASTNSNEQSSRSHTVCTIRLSGTDGKESHESVVNLIDLAGSERISQSGVIGERLKETQAINKSLSCLGDVIYSLSNGNNHVPFRNSKLTYLLQNSLSYESKVLMFVNVSPLAKNLNETVNSLRFATKVNTTMLNK